MPTSSRRSFPRTSLATVLACLVALLVLAWAGDALAKSGVQISRDGHLRMISKDVGDERWAITYDVDAHTAWGNVFLPSGGTAAFVWCEPLRTNGDPDPRRVELTFGCYGASPCDHEPCPATDWSFLSEVTLPGEFFLPPAAPNATPTPVQTAPPKPSRTPTPVVTPDALRDLLGTWTFETTIIDVFFDHYRLERVETVQGIQVITGTDLDDGGNVLLARPSDLLDEPFPYAFALLDPGSTICDFFVFDKSGPDLVRGADVLTGVSGGRCSQILTGNLNPMTGRRTARAATAATAGLDAPQAPEVQARREALVRGEDAAARSGAAATALPALDAVAARLIDVWDARP